MAASLTQHALTPRFAWTGALTRLALACAVIVTSLTLAACDDKSNASVAPVKIAGKTFFLELALDDATRFRGLSERTHIDPEGGMLFVFPPQLIMAHGFVMRDCPIPIDILYLDSAGRVVSSFAMVPEPPRDPAKGEGTPAEAGNPQYNARLKQYTSRFPAQFVVELAGGTLKTVNVKDGDLIEFNREDVLKRLK
ncbi:hypothetical protein BH11PLA1_BH11PLA1_18670 [soil metagenome]